MTEPLISLRSLGFAYSPDRTVIGDLDLDLFPGQRLGLVGDNGSGKTSLLHLMVGLLKPTGGSILAFGRERKQEADFVEVRAKAGLLFQDSEDQLFSPTVLEDVAFGPLNLGKGPKRAKEIALETLESLGLGGYGERITYRLSGGQKRLVALAAVLAMQPLVLLLDEPAMGLDEKSLARVREILQNLDQAMLIVSHRRDMLEGIVEGTVRLREGRLEPWDFSEPI